MTLLAHLVGSIDPRRSWFPALLALAHPLLVATLAACSLAWAARRSRRALWALPVLLLGLPNYFGFHLPTRPSGLCLVSMNANYFDYLKLSDPAEQRRRVELARDYLVKIRPDVICGQDFTADGMLEIEMFAQLKQQGWLYAYHGGSSQSTLSRYPIVRCQSTLFSDKTNSFQELDIQLPGGTVRVFNLHLHSYALGLLPRRTPLALLQRLGEGLQQRAEQVDVVSQAISRSPHPVWVVGDMNEVPLSYCRRQLGRGLRDGFLSAGRGWGFTYRMPFPFLRIDYVLHSPEFVSTSCRIDQLPLSDHLPVVCTLERRP